MPLRKITLPQTHIAAAASLSAHTHTLQRGEWVNSLTLPILKGRGCMDNISLNKFSVTERIILNLAAIGECRSKKISLKHPLRPISPSLDQSPLTDCIYGISTWWMPENRQWFNQDYSVLESWRSLCCDFSQPCSQQQTKFYRILWKHSMFCSATTDKTDTKIWPK